MKQKEFVKLFELSQEEEILYGTPPHTPMLNGSIQIFECTLFRLFIIIINYLFLFIQPTTAL
jgi:hypothetical protein